MFKSCNFFKDHLWDTIAIDTSNGWHKLDKKSREETFKSDHIIKFQKCHNCGKRRIEAADATQEGRTFALERHCDVALQATIWEEAGQITGYNDKNIVWVDTSYAPMRGFENFIKNLKKDPEFKELLKNQIIDDALGQLEVAVKLHVNNTPQVDTK